MDETTDNEMSELEKYQKIQLASIIESDPFFLLQVHKSIEHRKLIAISITQCKNEQAKASLMEAYKQADEEIKNLFHL